MVENNKELVRHLIGCIRPGAKFTDISHSSEFIEPGSSLHEDFYFVVLYDEKVDSNVIKYGNKLIIIDNSYLASFAYNLFLSYVYEYRKRPACNLDTPLIRYNFKKYYGEQLLHFYNNTFSRAILLETLLYEQHLMVPVFDEKDRDNGLNELARTGSSIFSNLVMYHEYGHYLLKNNKGIWHDFLMENNDVLGSLWEEVLQSYSPPFVTEFQCDTIGLLLTLQQNKDRTGKERCLRIMVFGYWAFAVMLSITKSAEHTSVIQRETVDDVDLESYEAGHYAPDYVLEGDPDFFERALLFTELCRRIAAKDALTIFGGDGVFGIDADIDAQMKSMLGKIMDSNNMSERKLSLLVAQAFHDHPKGMNYLYLRSKKFTKHDNESR